MLPTPLPQKSQCDVLQINLTWLDHFWSKKYTIADISYPSRQTLISRPNRPKKPDRPNLSQLPKGGCPNPNPKGRMWKNERITRHLLADKHEMGRSVFFKCWQLNWSASYSKTTVFFADAFSDFPNSVKFNQKWFRYVVRHVRTYSKAEIRLKWDLLRLDMLLKKILIPIQSYFSNLSTGLVRRHFED